MKCKYNLNLNYGTNRNTNGKITNLDDIIKIEKNL